MGYMGEIGGMKYDGDNQQSSVETEMKAFHMWLYLGSHQIHLLHFICLKEKQVIYFLFFQSG